MWNLEPTITHRSYQLPQGTSFTGEGPLLAVTHDLKCIIDFVRTLFPDAPAPIRLKLYEDWWERNGMHVYKKSVDLNYLYDLLQSPRQLIEAMPGDEYAYLGISDADNSLYLRCIADTDFNFDHIFAAYSFTCNTIHANLFRREILPLTKSAIKILSSDQHFREICR